MKIVKECDHLKLIDEQATFALYEKTINHLLQKKEFKHVGTINDFDEQYYLFEYESNTIVLSYSNFLGLCIYTHRKDLDIGTQERLLKQLSNVFVDTNND